MQRIDHAGYQRYILQRNPPRFDPDGEIVEPADEYEDDDDLSTVEENPYADIQLEGVWSNLFSFYFYQTYTDHISQPFLRP